MWSSPRSERDAPAVLRLFRHQRQRTFSTNLPEPDIVKRRKRLATHLEPALLQAMVFLTALQSGNCRVHSFFGERVKPPIQEFAVPGDLISHFIALFARVACSCERRERRRSQSPIAAAGRSMICNNTAHVGFPTQQDAALMSGQSRRFGSLPMTSGIAPKQLSSPRRSLF